MYLSDILRLVEILAWPTVTLVAIMVVRPHVSTLLSGAKIKFSVAGQTVETTLPELKQVFEEQASETLTPVHLEYLVMLQRERTKQYPAGIEKNEERVFLRPLRNAGLILVIPRNAFLHDAKATELSALGRLFLRARGASPKNGT